MHEPAVENVVIWFLSIFENRDRECNREMHLIIVGV
jgi:hypothetical protein